MQIRVRFTFAARGVLVMLAALAFGSGFPGAARAAEPFEIYALLPVTGPLAFYGQSIAGSLSAEERYINAAGGVNGRPIHFNILDDLADPQTAVQLATPLLTKGVQFIVDAGPAATCRATTAAAKTTAVVFCLSTAYQPAPGTYSFTTPFSLQEAVAAQVRFFRVRGLKRMGFLTATDATGQEVEAALTNVLALSENKDVVVAGRERFSAGDISVSAQLARTQSGRPQAMLVMASGAPLGLALRDMRDAGMVLPTATLASNQNARQITSYGDSVPADLELVSARWAAYSVMHGGPVKDAVTAFRRTMQSAGVDPDGPASLAWDPIMLFREAYRKAGAAATPAQIHDAIASIRGVAGICGYYDFVTTPGRGLTSKDTVVVRWDGSHKKWLPISAPGGTATL